MQHNKWAKQRAEIDSFVASSTQTQQHRLISSAPLTSYTTQRFASTHSTQSYSLSAATDPSTTPDNNLLALDCEYVGVGYEGQDDCLARVSIVNATGECIYDKYVKPGEEVVDYRTEVSGIRPGMLKNGGWWYYSYSRIIKCINSVSSGETFARVQQEVHSILNAGDSRRIVIGHAIHNDFKVLKLTYPSRYIRDTAKYKPLRQMAGGIVHKVPKLRDLTHHLLGVQIQQGEHDSVMDARMAMRLYLMHRGKWEREFKQQLAQRKRFEKKK